MLTEHKLAFSFNCFLVFSPHFKQIRHISPSILKALWEYRSYHTFILDPPGCLNTVMHITSAK